MSEQNDKLTAEEMAAKFAELSKPELFKGAVHGIYGENAVSDLMRQYEDAANFALNYTAQQAEHATAELSDLLERNRRISTKYQRVASELSKQVKKLNAENAELRKELERCQKEYHALFTVAEKERKTSYKRREELEALKSQLADAQKYKLLLDLTQIGWQVKHAQNSFSTFLQMVQRINLKPTGLIILWEQKAYRVTGVPLLFSPTTDLLVSYGFTETKLPK